MSLPSLTRIRRDTELIKPSRESLADRIVKLFVSSTFDAKPQDFLPQGYIETLVTSQAISEELKIEKYYQIPESDKQQFINWIVNKCSRVFAITVQCGIKDKDLVDSMIDFSDSNFSDAQPPIENPRSLSSSIKTQTQSLKQFNPDIWRTRELYSFYQNQWTFLAPVFSPDRYDYDLLSECIFPFIEVDGMPKVGAFSSVYKVKIHPSHLKHPNLEEVAVKEIKVNRGDDKTGTNNAWESEARALEAINKLDHAHIAKCIAAVRRGDSRYFMFPWADGDSLRDFWEQTTNQGPSAKLVLDAIVQLRGLADALAHLHNFDGGGRSRVGRCKQRTGSDGANGGHQINLTVQSDAKAPNTLVKHSELGDAGAVDGQKPTILQVNSSDEENEVIDYVDAPNNESIRHGDLKPENILRFKGKQDGLGMLKIADMGLAKRHVVATQDRSHLTSTRYGTIRYEAPETMTAIHGRSRLYDIWSMGCITLEFIIWILYGNAELNNFYNQVKGSAEHVCQYFEIPNSGGPKRAEVHKVVLKWMEHMKKFDPELSENTALRDLLDIVKTKLLVVPLPPNRASSLQPGPSFVAPGIDETITTYRVTAREFRKALDEILKKNDQPGYLFSGKSREKVTTPALPSTDFLSPMSPVSPRHPGIWDTIAKGNGPAPSGQEFSGILSGSANKTSFQDYRLPPLEGWEFPVDNAFAERVMAKIEVGALTPQLTTPAMLCRRCHELNFWAGGFSFEDTLADLHAHASQCHFCRMLYDICLSRKLPEGRTVRFERIQSRIVMAESEPLPILSIFRSNEAKTPLPIQLGFPELPKPRSVTFFKVIKAWLEDCDDNHRDKESGCEVPPPKNLPTRLIDVGTTAAPQLRLVETRKWQVVSQRYIALSHPWGDTAKHPPFSTLLTDPAGTGRDIESLKKVIPYGDLPRTFRDAVDCTRALGIQYLWIDSLCIIQGPDGDFNDEAKRMEDVFSGAYCVLAASRATGQRDGFLGERPSREYVTFQRRDEKPFYICKSIDDFSHHVLEGSLNNRGWVLQERALARRTVFFTEHQTYFECGKGVRCETLAKMHNNLADFLGDPKFPDLAMRTPSLALKISYFQTLYQQYSRLQFTRIEDRPFAIAGLEKRLQKAFDTGGGYGIFDHGPQRSLFHRSLLWQRARDMPPMTPIVFPVSRNIKVPSWSWMAYAGAIDYTDPPFQKADWEMKDIRSPWSHSANGNDVETAEHDDGRLLKVIVRDFNVAGRRGDETALVYDTERTASDGQRVQCVILARSRERAEKAETEKRIYVLLVAQMGGMTVRGEKLYQRVGAGYMLGKYISLDGPGTPGRVG